MDFFLSVWLFGAPLSAPAAKADHRANPRRALLENLAMLTASPLDYWRTYADFHEDWQFALCWRD